MFKIVTITLMMIASSSVYAQTEFYFDDSVIFSDANKDAIARKVKQETFFDRTEDSGCQVRMLSNAKFAKMYSENKSYAVANTRYINGKCVISFNDFFFLSFETAKFTETLIHEIAAHVYKLGHAKDENSIRHGNVLLNQKLSVSDKIIMSAMYFNKN